VPDDGCGDACWAAFCVHAPGVSQSETPVVVLV